MNMTIKSKMAEPIIQMYQMQQGFFSKALDGISTEDSLRRVSDHTNHIAWLTGHIVSCRYMLAGMLGLEESEPYPDLFGGLKGIGNDLYPSISDLQKEMPYISEKLVEKLGDMADEELNAPAHGGRLIDIILFFVYHEAYHIGQIGILRKNWGYEALNHQG